MNRLALLGLGLLWLVGTLLGFLVLVGKVLESKTSNSEDSLLGQAGLVFMAVLWIVGSFGLKQASPRVGWWAFLVWPLMQVVSLAIVLLAVLVIAS